MGVMRAVKTFAMETVDKFYELLGVDKRQPVADPATKPWCAVCFIESTFGENEKEHGSGFLISPRMVLTAAHNLCQLDDNGKRMAARQIEIRLGNLADSGQKPIVATRFVYDKRYADDLEQQETNSSGPRMRAVQFEDPSCYDYGVIFLDKEVVPKPVFVFKVRGTEPDDSNWDKPLMCAGYPADRNFKLCYAEGAAYPDASGRFMGKKQNILVHRTYATEGESGGPLYVEEENGEFVAVGIQVRYNPPLPKRKSTNGAVRITRNMQKAFEAWEEENSKVNSQLGKGNHDVDVDTQILIA